MKSLLILLLALLTATSARGAEIQYYPPDVSPWAFQHLVAMKEPSLFRRQSEAAHEEYRFLWLRTFHKPIGIRIWNDGRQAAMRIVRLSGAGGYEPGHIESDTTSPVSEEDWKRFRDFIAKAAFWQTPTRDAQEKPGEDGSQWILEASAAGKYHVVDRWAPRSGAYTDCCRFLITLARLQIPKEGVLLTGEDLSRWPSQPSGQGETADGSAYLFTEAESANQKRNDAVRLAVCGDWRSPQHISVRWK